ncbi:hypothetical protein HDU88_004773 [Geranomyces variabilis]|nr:hypothetical protein HDU88_004773 [Geranomyces variabilis]
MIASTWAAGLLVLQIAGIAADAAPFTLFTSNDLAAFRLPDACSAALATPLNCDRSAVFGGYAALGTADALNTFCGADGSCQKSIQAFATAVQAGCGPDVMLGPTANVASIVRHVLLSAALPCATDPATKANCAQVVKRTLSAINPATGLVGAVADRGIACGCLLAVSTLRRLVDPKADQVAFTLRTKMCTTDDTAYVMAKIIQPLLPIFPYVPLLEPELSTMVFSPIPDNANAQCGPSALTPNCPSGQCCNLSGQCGTGAAFCASQVCHFGFGTCTPLSTDPKAICGATSAGLKVCTVGCCNGNGLCGLGSADCMRADPRLPVVNGAPKGAQEGFGPGKLLPFVDETQMCGPYAPVNKTRCATGFCCNNDTGKCMNDAATCGSPDCNLVFGNCGPQVFDSGAACGFSSVGGKSCGQVSCCSAKGQCAVTADACNPATCQAGYGGCGWPFSVSCPKVSSLPGLNAVYYGNWTQAAAGGVATIPCPNGNAKGSVTANCLADGTWDMAQSTCFSSLAVCPAAAGWATALQGQNSTQPCANGYSGKMSAQCLASGQWSAPDVRQCQLVGCPAYDVFPSTAAGSTATAACPLPLIGNQTLTCNAATKTWALPPNVAACKVDTVNTGCVSVYFPRTPIGGMATAPCVLPWVGNMTATCLAGSVWTTRDESKCVIPPMDTSKPAVSISLPPATSTTFRPGPGGPTTIPISSSVNVKIPKPTSSTKR